MFPLFLIRSLCGEFIIHTTHAKRRLAQSIQAAPYIKPTLLRSILHAGIVGKEGGVGCVMRRFRGSSFVSLPHAW